MNVALLGLLCAILTHLIFSYKHGTALRFVVINLLLFLRSLDVVWEPMMSNQHGTYGRPYPRYVAHQQALVTKFHTMVYQLSGGRLGATLFGLPMLLLTTWGRRTGKLRTTPLLYLPVDDVFVLVASNGGAQRHPTWWLNLQTTPEALVQIGPVRGRVHARGATQSERVRFWPLLLQVYPPYAQYQARTDREIPLIVLHPIDDQLYDHIPARYKQQHVHKDL